MAGIPSNIMHLTDDTLQETIKTEKRPIFVDFYADWCGPCVAAAPIIDKLAKEFQDKMLITKLNVDENPRSAQQYGVMSIPTVVLFDKGVEVERQVGYGGKEMYEGMVK